MGLFPHPPPMPFLAHIITPRRVARLSAILIYVLLGSSAQAGDLGEIATPAQSIQKVFPDSDRYETHVRVLERTRVEAIRELMPAGIEYHELGKRVVYSAYKKSSPLGFLHVRNENGRWGVVQIAWHINLDLTIRDFTVLRGREPEQPLLESDAFKDLVRAGGIEELARLLDENGQILPDRTRLPSHAHQLASIVIASAIKSLGATQVGWSLDLSKSMIRDRAARRFPAAETVEFEHAALSGNALVALEKAHLPSFDTQTRNSLLLARVVDAEGAVLASLLHIRLEVDGQVEPLLFTIVDHQVTDAHSLAELPRPQILSRLSRIPRMSFEQLRESICEVARSAAISICVAEPTGAQPR